MILIYILICFILMFLSAKTSYRFNLVDKPNKRKIHTKPTAYTGGIVISIILLISIKLFNIFDDNINLILSTAFLVSVLGLVDDRYNLNSGSKLSLQIIPIFYLVLFESLTLSQLGNYDYFILELGAFTIPFTLLSVLFLTNSFNYFDGMDGTLVITSISVLGILYFLIPNKNLHFFLITFLIPLVIFLFFNFSIFKIPKLFLGDSGSLFLGFIISFLLIYLANRNFTHPILLAWSVVIFVYEFLSINIIRIKDKKDLFKAGKDHFHHLLFQKNNSIFKTNLIIALTNFIFFCIGYISYLFFGPLTSLVLFVACFIIFLIVRINKFKKI